MKRAIFLSMLLTLALNAATLPELIDGALTRHPSLEAIAQRVAAADVAVQRAKNFDNPNLRLFVNDLRFDDFTNRSLEPMQTQGVVLTQKIPAFGKREAREAVAKARKKLAFATLQEARAALAERIRTTAYTIWEMRRLIGITEATIRLAEQNIDLFEGYTATGRTPGAHMGIMSAQLMKSRLRTSIVRLRAQEEGMQALLKYLTFRTEADVALDPPKPRVPAYETLTRRLRESPVFKEALAQESLDDKELAVEKLTKRIDPVVSVGYSNRAEFEDYLNIGVGFALPIYGTEENRIQERRKLSLASKLRRDDTLQRLESRLKTLYAKLKDEAQVVAIIEEESLPDIEHMFELVQADIASGGDIYRYIDLLEQKFRLEARAIRAKATFYKTLARIDALIGAKQ